MLIKYIFLACIHCLYLCTLFSFIFPCVMSYILRHSYWVPNKSTIIDKTKFNQLFIFYLGNSSVLEQCNSFVSYVLNGVINTVPFNYHGQKLHFESTSIGNFQKKKKNPQHITDRCLESNIFLLIVCPTWQARYLLLKFFSHRTKIITREELFAGFIEFTEEIEFFCIRNQYLKKKSFMFKILVEKIDFLYMYARKLHVPARFKYRSEILLYLIKN